MIALPASWTEPYPLTLSSKILEHLAVRHSLRGGALGQELRNVLRTSGPEGLVRFPIHEVQCLPGVDVLNLMHIRQMLAFYQKNSTVVVPGVDPEANAKASWLEAEDACQLTNRLFTQARGSFVWDDEFRHQAHVTTVSLAPNFVKLLAKMRGIIKTVLGKAPAIADLKLRFGPGSTTSIKRNMSCPQEKLAEQPTCSYKLFASGFLPTLLSSMPHYTEAHGDPVTTFSEVESGDEVAVYAVNVVLTDGSVQFVLKNALTRRAMESQPTLNSMFQLGLGGEMTVKMRRAGINLRDQGANRAAAKVGSINNELVTIDLSSASDMKALELVREVIPEDWFALLDAARCTTTTLDGEVVRLEKFSAMGNGFTFPLETLIFWAACHSVAEHRDEILCYGDDIIVHREDAEKVVWALTVCGFKVNTKKSYLNGPFRESCGSDWYRGISVRPYYQKTGITAMQLFQLYNFYIRNYELGEKPGMFSNVVLGYIHPDLVRYGPDGYGDGHLISKFYVLRRNRMMKRSGWGGGFFKTFKLQGARIKSRFPCDYVTPLYVTYVQERPSNDGTAASLLVKDSQPVMFATSEHNGETFGRPIWDVPIPTDTDYAAYEEVDIYTFCEGLAAPTAWR